MPVYIQGALIGLAISVLLVVVEVVQVNKAAKERGEARHKKPEIEPEEKIRVRAVITFSLFIPPAFALGAWLLWG